MSAWDIAYLVLAIIWVTLMIIEITFISIQCHLRDKEIRHVGELRYELEKKIKEFNERGVSLKYRLGTENCCGSLLCTKDFSSDKELWDYILDVNEKYVKTGDLKNPKFIIQVYKDEDEMVFTNCLSQFCITPAENL